MRPAESSGNTPALEAIASFRGHTFRTPVSDVIIDELKRLPAITSPQKQRLGVDDHIDRVMSSAEVERRRESICRVRRRSAM